MTLQRIFAIFVAGFGVCAQAEAYDGVAFAGGSVSRDSSAYAGAIIALPGSSLGDGLALKAAASGGVYDYQSGAGRIDATYYGGVLGLAHQWSGNWGWANLSGGVRFTQTDLSPSDPANEREGRRFDAALGADGALVEGAWRLGWYAEGGVRDESYLARLQLTRSVVPDRLRLGVEGMISGDPQYRAENIGIALSAPLGGDFEIQLSGGAQFQRGLNEHGYFSIGFVKLF